MQLFRSKPASSVTGPQQHAYSANKNSQGAGPSSRVGRERAAARKVEKLDRGNDAHAETDTSRFKRQTSLSTKTGTLAGSICDPDAAQWSKIVMLLVR